MDDDLETWFVREVLALEPALTRYIARFRGNVADIQEIRQEVYVKVLEAAEKKRPPMARYFLFAVARNLLTDLARRRRVVPIELMQNPESLEQLVDELSPERSAGGQQQIRKLSHAFEALPRRCREVVWMRKVQELPQKEIARRLAIAEGTVESHLVRGMRLLAQLYYDRDAEQAVGRDPDGTDMRGPPPAPGPTSRRASWRAG